MTFVCLSMSVYVYVSVCRSAWLELSQYCQKKAMKIPTWEEVCTSYNNHSIQHPHSANSTEKDNSLWGGMNPIDKQCGRAMYAFFMSHVYLEKHRGDLALQVLVVLLS